MMRAIAGTVYRRLPRWCQRKAIDVLAFSARIPAARRRVLRLGGTTAERAADLAAGDPVLRDVCRAHAVSHHRASIDVPKLLVPLIENDRLVHEDYVILIKSLMAEGRIDACRRPFEKACSWARSRNASARVHAEIALLAIGLDDSDAAVEFSDRSRSAWLRQYVACLYGTGVTVTEPALVDRRSAGAGSGSTVALGLLDYGTPVDRPYSNNLGDFVQTLAVARHLARFYEPGTYRCDERLETVFRELARSWKADERMRAGRRVEVGIVVVDRDCVRRRGDLWLPFFGWFHPNSNRTRGIRLTFPMPAHVRPLFFSFHLHDIGALTPRLCDYLKQYEPIGCRDRTTRDRLASAGVKAFLSGCITTTLALPDDAQPGGEVGAFYQVDDVAEPIAGAMGFTHEMDPDDRKPLAQCMVDALEALRVYKRARGVSTSRLHCYLPCRAMGTPVTFNPKDPADERFDGLVGIGDNEFQAMRIGLTELMAKVFGRILAGADAETVYRTWRQATLPLVERDETERRGYPRLFVKTPNPAPEPRARRTDRVQISFSFDRNLVGYLPNVVRSIEANTSHGVTYHLLTRGLTNADRHAVQNACPDAAIQWHTMDGWLTKADQGGLVYHTNRLDNGRLRIARLAAADRQDCLPGCRLDRTGGCRRTLRVAVGRQTARGRDRIPPRRLARELRALEHARRTTRRTSPAPACCVQRRGTVEDPAFNAGVLVMSLDAMRRDGFTVQAERIFGEFGYDDQTLLNCYAGGDYAELPQAWNVA